MRSAAPLTILLVTLALVLGAGVILLTESRSQPNETARAEEFQELVGGVGFGPAVDLSGCAFAFDPRLCPCCGRELGPIPGGRVFCPHHASSILDYPPLDPARGREER